MHDMNIDDLPKHPDDSHLQPSSWMRELMDEISADPKMGVPKFTDDEVGAIEEIFALGLKQTIQNNPKMFVEVVRKKIDQTKTIKSARRVLSEFKKNQKKK